LWQHILVQGILRRDILLQISRLNNSREDIWRTKISAQGYLNQNILRWMKTDSVAGSNTSLTSNRPILEAKPPSRRISRSTSPIRSTLAVLRSAAPPIDICQPGPAAATIPDEAVHRLKGFLLDGYDKAFIPRQLEVYPFAQFPTLILTPSYRPDYVELLRMKLLSCTMQCFTTITDTHLKSLTRCGRISKTYVTRPMHVAIS